MMNKKTLLPAWAVLFILCAILGMLPEPAGWVRGVMNAAALLFFLPPLYLLRQAQLEGDTRLLKLLRNLSALSLGLTVVLLIGNFLTVGWPEYWGTVLHYVLAIVSTPMLCGGSWALSLFLWAVLLIWTAQSLRA